MHLPWSTAAALRLGFLFAVAAMLAAPSGARGQADEPDEPGATTQPDEIRRGMRMGDAPAERYRRYWDALVRRVEPSGAGEIDRREVYLDFFRREIIRDPRLFAFDVRLDVTRSAPGEVKVLIDGSCEFQEQADALVVFLRALNLDLSPPRVGVMPTPSVTAAGGPLAIARGPSAFLRARPDEKSEKVNEAIAGEPLWLLDRRDGWYLCHSADGYVGWVDQASVEKINPDHFTAIINAHPPRHSDQIEAVIAEAHRRLGRPYIWGGRSEEGVDCSGLVQRAFASQGIHLPRDAEQQALVGRLVATRWHRDALRRGDLLFFMGRRGFISHTGIYLGENRMIESADGGVRVSDFAEGSSLWQRFCFAKRVLD